MPVPAKGETIHTEASFTDVSQNVQRTDIDMFGGLLDKSNVCLDIYFTGTLHKFNMPFL